MAKPKKPAANKAPAKKHSTKASRGHGGATAPKRTGSSSARKPVSGNAVAGRRKVAQAKKPVAAKKVAALRKSVAAKKPVSAKKPVPAKKPVAAKKPVRSKPGPAKPAAVKAHAPARVPAAPPTSSKNPELSNVTPAAKGVSAAKDSAKTKNAAPAKPVLPAKPPAPRLPLGAAVEAYIADLGDWRGEAVSRVCQLLAANAPRATGLIRYGHPVYEQKGPFAYVRAEPHVVYFGFWRGARLEDPDKLLVGEGDRMRKANLWSASDVREERFAAWIREAVRLNQELGDPTKMVE